MAEWGSEDGGAVEKNKIIRILESFLSVVIASVLSLNNMKHAYMLLMFLFGMSEAKSQKGFSVEAAFSPKMSINNNTSATVKYSSFLPNNEADGRSALGYSYDYHFRLAYTFGKNNVSAGIGRFDVRQMFRVPFTLFGPGF